MQSYLSIVQKILDQGIDKSDRTGTGTRAVAGVLFEHDMAQGFPLLTTKKMPFRLIASELEFFLKGITDKEWLRERNNHIWDDWCSPDKVPYGHDAETQARMAAERELGPVYGWQWRHFGGEYSAWDQPPHREGVDQIAALVEGIKKNPQSRRLMVTAWNPVDLPRMALPPCHYGFQVTILGDRLNLMWNQRSVDVALGLPFNIASYGLLLHLLAKETGYTEGRLVGFFGDTHIYSNHTEGLREQLKRSPRALPRLITENFQGLDKWSYTNSRVEGYQPHPRIAFPIAI